MSQPLYDVIIIGGGPAGLTAGLYTSRAKLKTLLIERMIMGGQVMTTTKVENYPGFPGGIDGPDLMVRFQEHCQEFGLVVDYGEVENLQEREKERIVTVDGRDLRARAVIIATGAEPRKLGVAGEQEFTGRISFISPRVDVATRTFQVKAEVSNDQRLLSPGMFARAEVVTEIFEEALTVPWESVIQTESETYLYAVEGEVARKVPLRLGKVTPQWAQVYAEDLQPGAAVVLEGKFAARDGGKVSVKVPAGKGE